MTKRKRQAKRKLKKTIDKQPFLVRFSLYGWAEDHPLHEAVVNVMKNRNKILRRKNLIHHMKNEVKRLKAEGRFSCCNTSYVVEEIQQDDNQVYVITCTKCKQFIGVTENEFC